MTMTRLLAVTLSTLALTILGGCAADTEDPPAEEQAAKEETGEASDALLCLPKKMPICGSGETLVCETVSGCRTCRCTIY